MTTGDDPRVDGELERAEERWRLRFRRKLAHPPEKVWRAITEPSQLKAWFPDTIEGELIVGGTLRFVSPYRPDGVFEGEILEFLPPSVLESRWDANETVRFEVRPDGDGCVLTLLNTFDELGKASRDAAGWHTCLDVLGYEVGGTTAPAGDQSQWQRLQAGYAAKFGPEAATIGPPEHHPYAD